MEKYFRQFSCAEIRYFAAGVKAADAAAAAEIPLRSVCT